MSAPNPLAPIFDAAIAKLNAQPDKAMDPAVGCFYRLGECACFFGHMIKDEHYRPVFDARYQADGEEWSEGLTVSSEDVIRALRNSTGVNFLEYLSALELQRLQHLHDCEWQPGTDFKALLRTERPALYANIYGEPIIEEGVQA